MAKAKDLAGLAALGALGYMLNKKSYKEDAGDQKTSSYTGDTKKVAASDDRMSNEDYIKSRMKKAPEAEDANYGNEGRRTSMGVAPAPKTTTKAAPKLETITTRKDPREAEAGMSRGTRTTSMAGAGRGFVNPPSVRDTDARSAEAGMSRGTRTTSTAGAGRGSVNPPSVSATNPRSAETGMSRGTRNMTPSPGQADIDKIRRIQEASRIPSSMAGRPGYDEAGNRMKHGGAVKMASGGMTASRRADGIATKGKTRGKIC